MKQKGPITIVQMILLIMTAIGLHNHVVVISPLIQEAGRDAWLSVIASTALALIWAFLLLFIHRGMNQQNPYRWLKKNVGKPFAVFAGILIYLYFIYLGTVTLKETMTWTKITYLQETPQLILTLVLVSLCIAAALMNIRTIAIANLFILAFVLVFGFFVAFINIKYKDYSLLAPILEHGFEPVAKGMIFPATGLGELVLVIALQHKLAGIVRYRHIAITMLLLAGLTLGPLIGGIVEFGPDEAGNQRFTAFEEWGLASLGKYIEHLDFLSIYQWLAGAFIRITLMFYSAMEIFGLKKMSAKLFTLFVLAGLSITFTMIPIADEAYYQLLKSVLMPASLLFCLMFSFVFAGIIAVLKLKKRKERKL